MEEDWQPPTEAELKVIEAARERSNKISKLMGSYLLKGYKMLATTCRVCDTIELQDRQGNLYCVACSEVDSYENSKDNPVFSEVAASRQIAEAQYTGQSDAQPTAPVTAASLFMTTAPKAKAEFTSTQLAKKSSPLPVLPTLLPSLSELTPAREAEPTTVSVGVQRELYGLEVKDVCHQAILELQQKINWATQELRLAKDTSSTLEYCQVLKISAEAISALKHAAL